MLLPATMTTAAPARCCLTPKLPSPSGGDGSDGRSKVEVTEVRYERPAARYELPSLRHTSHTSPNLCHLSTLRLKPLFFAPYRGDGSDGRVIRVLARLELGSDPPDLDTLKEGRNPR